MSEPTIAGQKRAPSPLAGAEALVVGGAGMLGRAMRAELEGHGARVGWSGRADLDIADRTAVRRAIGERHRFVVNCAAYTDVDGAEREEEQAFRVNAIGAGELAARCAETGSLLVHISTDYVFDGEREGPYPTDHPRAPKNAYGRSKAAGEEAVERAGCEHILARTSWLYAPWGRNFVRTIAALARDRQELRVVNDQRGRPSSAEGVARSVALLIASGARGPHHTTDGGECSWFELACHIVSETGSGCVVRPCATAEFPRPAARPRNSVLDLSATERLIGPMRDWREAVSDVIRRLED